MTDTDDAERPPLNSVALTKQVVRPGGLWSEVLVVARTGSTNTDCAARARAGAPEGLVLAAEEQTAGRGRLGRTWLSPPRAALTFSVLLRPAGVPPARRGWLPLLAGVATATAVRHVSGLDARLKWPNDLLLGPRKLAGILAEQSGDAVIVGIGVNVSAARAELPVTAAAALPAAAAAGRRAAAAALPALPCCWRVRPAWTGNGCFARSWPRSSAGTERGVARRSPVIRRPAGSVPRTWASARR